MERIKKKGKIMKKNKKGFTLAETLIALTILGIIAAISLTSIYKHYQRRVVATKITEFYRTWEKAFDLSQIENGPISTWFVDNYNNSDDVDKLIYEKYITPYLNLINGDNRNSVFRVKNGANFYEIKQPNGNLFLGGSANPGFYKLKNNICIHPNMHTQNGKVTYSRNPSTGVTYYGEAYIDINCEQGPNVAGKDAFIFQIYKNDSTDTMYIAPIGAPNGISTTKINQLKNSCKNGGGHDCAYWVLEEGFNKIPKDYPWL